MADVFQASNGVAGNFHNGQIELVINGSSKGRVNVGTGTVGQFIDTTARTYGLKTFSVYLTQNSSTRKLDTTEAAQQFPTGSTKIELVAKDARGDGDDAASTWTCNDEHTRVQRIA
jgi:hypothetical protein